MQIGLVFVKGVVGIPRSDLAQLQQKLLRKREVMPLGWRGGP